MGKSKGLDEVTAKALPLGLLSLSRPPGRPGLAGMLKDGELGFWASGVSLPHFTIQLALCSLALPCHFCSILISQDVPSASRCDTFWSPAPSAPSPKKYDPQAPLHLLRVQQSPARPHPTWPIPSPCAGPTECLLCLPSPQQFSIAGVRGTSLQSCDPLSRGPPKPTQRPGGPHHFSWGHVALWS